MYSVAVGCICDGNNRRPPIMCCSGRRLNATDSVNKDHSDGKEMERWRNGNVKHSVIRPLGDDSASHILCQQTFQDFREKFGNLKEGVANSELRLNMTLTDAAGWKICIASVRTASGWVLDVYERTSYRTIATRVSQLKIWHFWVIIIERNVCRYALLTGVVS